MSSQSDVRTASHEQAHHAIITLIDFVYALTFGFFIAETFSEYGRKGWVYMRENFEILVLVGWFSYFFVWDWILGRLLTIRNPLRGYTVVFCELVLAAMAYLTIAVLLRNKMDFLIPFILFLTFGVVWAYRTFPKASKRDRRELSAIVVTQFFGALVFAYFAAFWIGRPLTWNKAVQIIFVLVSIIFVYEIGVPRAKGILGGPGVPFVPRSRLRWIRKCMRKSSFGLLLKIKEVLQ